MQYVSTRGASPALSFSQAVMQGIAPDGGLYVPETFPQVSLSDIAALAGLPYDKRAVKILAPFVDFDLPTLEKMCAEAYCQPNFDHPAIAPTTQVGEAFHLELYHGPTFAFKDMALQMLPRFMAHALKASGAKEDVVILVATSGDTGKAALEGFCNVEGTQVVVFYPDGGVSPTQKLQMITQRGDNCHVSAVYGNFDDAQTGVKKLFASEEFAAQVKACGGKLSSANSINFGRLVPQIAYYFSAYADLLNLGAIKLGDEVDFCVPTGNFGDILACHYAKNMGLPVGRMLCASNKNNVLTDFINTGVYDKNRPFHKTTSPSMDILVSSNVERLLYHLLGEDGQKVAALMDELAATGRYELPEEAKNELQSLYYAGWADEDAVNEEIATLYGEGHVADPHTAVASRVWRAQKKAGDASCVIVSTASPYKFSRAVLSAIAPLRVGEDELALAAQLEEVSAIPMPEKLAELANLPVRHGGVCEKEAMGQTVLDFLR